MRWPVIPEPIRFWRGRQMYLIIPSHTEEYVYLGLRDGQVVTRGVEPSEVARTLIQASN